MKIAPLFPAAILALSAVCPPSWAQAGGKGGPEIGGEVLYRYKDEHGVQVLDDLVPPRYVADGYEILSLSGRVLKVVPPQPPGEELAEQRRRETQREEDLKLLKRYNSVTDIESTRSRKLAVVDQDMAIMRSNITSLRRQVEQEETAAARTQRNGGEVPPDLLARIADLKKEIGVLQERLDRREAEAERLNREFDRAARRYAEISE